MSKLYDNLKKNGEIKKQNGTHSSDKEIARDITNIEPSSEKREVRSFNFNRRVLAVFGIILIFLVVSLGLDLVTFMMLKKTFVQRADIIEARLIKAEKIGKQLDLLIIGIKGLNDDLTELSSKIKGQNEQIAKLEDTFDAQEVAIDNLRKAKDIIFKRLSTLEAVSSNNPQ